MQMGGVTEVAELLGVSKQRVAKLRERADFPTPLGELAQGPVWDLAVVASWNGSGLRQSGAGRPRAEVLARTLGGRFSLEEPAIGSGGFADVYRATDNKPEQDGHTRQVAIKVLRDFTSLDGEAVKRFRRELRLLEDLTHDHVIRVLAHGDTTAEGLWYAMPLATGSLSGFVEQCAGEPSNILDVMRQVCAGVGYLHERGVCHRDLKPGNVLLTEAGLWAVSDLGLAVEFERSTVLTSTLRAGLGSWCYTAPEQWTQARSADERSDIYSLGKILQQLVTGDLPVTSEMQPSPLRPVVEKAIAAQPGQRYQCVGDLLKAVEMALGQTGEWESPEDAGRRLLGRLRTSSPGADTLAEVLAWAQALDENDDEDMVLLTKVLPGLSAGSISKMWRTDPGAFQRIYERYSNYVQHGGFGWDYCDTLAEFGDRVVDQTRDRGMLRLTLRSLIELGRNHNRWHVQGVVIGILQSITTTETAVAAAEAIRDADRQAVEWTLNDFSVRTLQPILRATITDYLKDAS